MGQALVPATRLLADTSPPSDSIRWIAVVGWSIVAIFFGGFGTWAITAPLNGAVVARAVVKVEGNRKSVQHLDGGIVKELRVKEGDEVNAGDVVIVLDDTQARAEYEVFAEDYVVLRATEERLRTELDHGSQLVMPDELASRGDDPYVKSIWNGQVRQFESRRAALEGQRGIIHEKIAQLEQQTIGSEGQVKAYRAQLDSVRDEHKSLIPLVEKGLIARPRTLQLERTGAGLEGQLAETEGSIAKDRQAIAEQQQQMVQLDYDQLTEVTKDLRDTQARLVEVLPRLMNAKAILGRMEIRSPYMGKVVGLNVFSVGGVIKPGEKILDIVPDQQHLITEAQIAVDDISDVHPGMRAEVHLTAYKQRIIPVIHGDVVQVSADRLVDERTGAPYYVVLVEVDEQELADLPNIHLYPGMPATVMIPTTERTAFDYLMGPLVMSFNQAFRQR
jgi:epimerase transport system membrane fusion protein